MKRNATRTCIRGARPGGRDVGRWTYLKQSATLKVMFVFTVSPQGVWNDNPVLALAGDRWQGDVSYLVPAVASAMFQGRRDSK